MALYDTFGDIVGKARWGLGLSGQELAGRAGCRAHDLAAWENGDGSPATDQAERLAVALHLHPAAARRIAAGAYEPVPPAGLAATWRAVTVTAMEANAYVVIPAGQRKALIVDPGGDVAVIMLAAAESGCEIAGLLATHAHADHIGALGFLCSQLQVPALMCAPVAPAGAAWAALYIPWEGDGTYEVGGLPVQAHSCPGHSYDSVAFLVDDALFTGDTIFAGSLGRAAHPQAYPQLLASARRLLTLPAATGVLPGHGPASTITQESVANPFLAGAGADFS